MAAEKHARATWRGDLTSGSGMIESVGSGTFGPLEVTWAARTGERGEMTSPEELIAAAHAACFSMALSNILAKEGTSPESLAVSASVTFVPGEGVKTSALDVTGVVPGMEEDAFGKFAEQARDDCPVSQALKGNVELSVTSRLSGS